MTRLTTDDAVYHARTQMTSVGYVSMVTPPDARYASRVSRASFIIIHHRHHRQKRKKRGTLKKYLSFARRVDRRKRGGDVYIDGAPKRATNVCVLTTCYLLSLSAAHKNAVVSSVRVSEVGARQVHGAVAIAMQRQARGGDVQVLRDATARLEKYVISRRRTRE